MGMYIVTYATPTSQTEHADLLRAIQACDDWAKLNDNAYMVKSDNGAIEIRNTLSRCASGTPLFVAAIHGDAAWRALPMEVGQWIKSTHEEENDKNDKNGKK